MSSEYTFSPKAKLVGLSLHPLVAAAGSVFGDLTPLLSADSPIDENLSEQLRNILEVFAKGVEFAFLAVQHTMVGLLNITQLWKRWDGFSPHMRLAELQLVTDRFLFAEANSVDGRDAYVEAKSRADPLFVQLLETYGPDMVLEVSSIRKFTNKLNFEKSTIQDTGIRVTSHLDQSESRMTAFMEFLQEFNKTLRDFLGDERISLAQSLQDLPFWSSNPLRIWEGMYAQLRNVDSELAGAVVAQMAWFKCPFDTTHELTTSDLKLRASRLVRPDIKVQVPEPKVTAKKSTLTQTWFPSDLVRLTMGSDGNCVIHIANIEQSKPGTTTVKFNFAARATRSWISRLECLVVHCNVRPEEDSPFRVVAHHPSNVKDLCDDPHFQPKHCHPQLDIVSSSTSATSSVDWKFSRPIFRWARGTVFPTDLSISLDVEHSVGLLVDVRLTFTYRRLFIWKFTEYVPADIYVSAEQTAASTEPARV